MKNEPDCYGKMFPLVVAMTHNKPVSGEVFGYEVDYAGQVASRRVVTVNREAWWHCLGCPEFDGCYRLSAGTALMELAVKTLPDSLY
jgi:hypothetical protein